MAKRLKKEKVNVDVINFGEEVFSHKSYTQITPTHTTYGLSCVLLLSLPLSGLPEYPHYFSPLPGDEHRETNGLRQHTEW